MKILKVTFYRDLKASREVLTGVQYHIFKSKSSLIMDLLRARFPRKDVNTFSYPDKDGFYIEIEKETEKEIQEQNKQMDDLMLNSKPPQGFKKIEQDRFFRTMKRKFRNFKTDVLKKATKKDCLLELLNSAGILVKWELL